MNCKLYGDECTFVFHNDKRKPYPKEYIDALHSRIRILENLLAESKIPLTTLQLGGRRNAIKDIKLSRTAEAKSNTDPSQQISLSDSANPSSVDAAATIPSSSTTNKLEDTTSKELQTITSTNPRPSWKYIQKLSGRLGHLSMTENGLRYFGPISNLHLLSSIVWTRQPCIDLESKGRKAIEDACIEYNYDPNTLDHLLNLYWTWHHPFLAVTDKTLFLRDMDLYENKGVRNPSAVKFYSPLLLNAMLSLASLLDDSYNGHLYHIKARILLDIEIENPQITTVQAAALMGLYEMVCDRDTRGFIYSGIAMRMAVDLGYHLDQSVWIERGLLSREEVYMRSVTFWGCFVSERLVSFSLGRPSSLSIADVTLERPVDPDEEPSEANEKNSKSGSNAENKKALENNNTKGPSSLQKNSGTSNPTNAAAHQPYKPDGAKDTWVPYVAPDVELPKIWKEFTALTDLQKTNVYLIKLIEIISEIQEVIYSDNDPKSLPKLWAFASETHVKLSKWITTLPSPLLCSANSQRPIISHIVLLHLLYHSALIYLHRPFLLMPTNSAAADSSSSQPDKFPEINVFAADHATDICREAALGITNLLSRYDHSWYTLRRIHPVAVHITFSAATIHLMNAWNDEGMNKVNATQGLKTCCESLASMGQAYETAKRSLSIITSLMNKGRNGFSDDNSLPQTRIATAIHTPIPSTPFSSALKNGNKNLPTSNSHAENLYKLLKNTEGSKLSQSSSQETAGVEKPEGKNYTYSKDNEDQAMLDAHSAEDSKPKIDPEKPTASLPSNDLESVTFDSNDFHSNLNTLSLNYNNSQSDLLFDFHDSGSKVATSFARFQPDYPTIASALEAVSKDYTESTIPMATGTSLIETTWKPMLSRNIDRYRAKLQEKGYCSFDNGEMGFLSENNDPEPKKASEPEKPKSATAPKPKKGKTPSTKSNQGLEKAENETSNSNKSSPTDSFPHPFNDNSFSTSSALNSIDSTSLNNPEMSRTQHGRSQSVSNAKLSFSRDPTDPISAFDDSRRNSYSNASSSTIPSSSVDITQQTKSNSSANDFSNIERQFPLGFESNIPFYGSEDFFLYAKNPMLHHNIMNNENNAEAPSGSSSNPANRKSGKVDESRNSPTNFFQQHGSKTFDYYNNSSSPQQYYELKDCPSTPERVRAPHHLSNSVIYGLNKAINIQQLQFQQMQLNLLKEQIKKLNVPDDDNQQNSNDRAKDVDIEALANSLTKDGDSNLSKGKGKLSRVPGDPPEQPLNQSVGGISPKTKQSTSAEGSKSYSFGHDENNSTENENTNFSDDLNPGNAKVPSSSNSNSVKSELDPEQLRLLKTQSNPTTRKAMSDLLLLTNPILTSAKKKQSFSSPSSQYNSVTPNSNGSTNNPSASPSTTGTLLNTPSVPSKPSNANNMNRKNSVNNVNFNSNNNNDGNIMNQQNNNAGGNGFTVHDLMHHFGMLFNGGNISNAFSNFGNKPSNNNGMDFNMNPGNSNNDFTFQQLFEALGGGLSGANFAQNPNNANNCQQNGLNFNNLRAMNNMGGFHRGGCDGVIGVGTDGFSNSFNNSLPNSNSDGGNLSNFSNFLYNFPTQPINPELMYTNEWRSFFQEMARNSGPNNNNNNNNRANNSTNSSHPRQHSHSHPHPHPHPQHHRHHSSVSSKSNNSNEDNEGNNEETNNSSLHNDSTQPMQKLGNNTNNNENNDYEHNEGE